MIFMNNPLLHLQQVALISDLSSKRLAFQWIKENASVLENYGEEFFL